MSYINPLHPPVPSNVRSSYTALAGACSTNQPPFAQALPPSHRRLPQAPLSKMSTSRRSPPCPAVTFDLHGAPSRGLGVPMGELLTRSEGALERMLVGVSDGVGAQMSGSLGFRRVNLKILWPGYEHLDRSYPLDIYTPAGPLTRGQLAVQVARAFARFIEELQGHPPAQHGASWRFGNGGISFNRLILSALWNACDDVWLAEVIVDFR
ncbi:uncharacterized protein EDB91DRAFT_1176412 [Suillus paluster]|uniref:uncharacterized protein n=1 Tax=Suillus paluster TaxID=48578 RepID=UPI001B878491|nr:uncharacterized protein EDB91DRAFT_1176412 [Suillus paluster]KAG1721259.1 hypothetical protein EDB91DRAFT_1176412 [Suillus paluster]